MNELGLLAGGTALLAIVAQTGAMFYWGGRLQAMVTQLKDADEDKETRIRRLEGLDFRRDLR